MASGVVSFMGVTGTLNAYPTYIIAYLSLIHCLSPVSNLFFQQPMQIIVFVLNFSPALFHYFLAITNTIDKIIKTGNYLQFLLSHWLNFGGFHHIQPAKIVVGASFK